MTALPTRELPPSLTLHRTNDDSNIIRLIWQDETEYRDVLAKIGDKPEKSKWWDKDIYPLWPDIVPHDPKQILQRARRSGLSLNGGDHWTLYRYNAAQKLYRHLHDIGVTQAGEYDTKTLLTTISWKRKLVQDAFRKAIKAKYPDFEENDNAKRALNLIEVYAGTELGGTKKDQSDLTSFLASLKQVLTDRSTGKVTLDLFFSRHFESVMEAAFFVTQKSYELPKANKEWDDFAIPIFGFRRATCNPAIQDELGTTSHIEVILALILASERNPEFALKVIRNGINRSSASESERDLMLQLVDEWWGIIKNLVHSGGEMVYTRRMKKDLENKPTAKEFKAAVDLIARYIEVQVESDTGDPVSRMQKSRKLMGRVINRLSTVFARHVKQDEGKTIESEEDKRLYADLLKWHLNRTDTRLNVPGFDKKGTLSVRESNVFAYNVPRLGKRGNFPEIPALRPEAA